MQDPLLPLPEFLPLSLGQSQGRGWGTGTLQPDERAAIASTPSPSSSAVRPLWQLEMIVQIAADCIQSGVVSLSPSCVYDLGRLVDLLSLQQH